MEQTDNTVQMLNLLAHPAFCVKDGIILCANHAAIQQGIASGSGVSGLLITGHREYEAFTGGCLYLTLKVADSARGASVVRMDGFDVFVLEEDPDQSQLQAVALAAQELRHPLSNIMTVTDSFFPQQQFDDDPSAQEQIARINRGLHQIHRIVGNMSDAYRYSHESGSYMEIRDICAVMEETFAKCATLLSHAEITLQFTNLNEQILCLVDTEKLERAISNIISNAAKFTASGGRIDARLTRHGTMLYLTVSDSGSGKPEALGNNVFTRYLRQPNVEDARHGIGLGMVLIRSAAAIHGGTVLMESLPEQGTRLTMTLRIRQNTDPMVRSNTLHVDYAGERDHALVELSDILPVKLYGKDALN